jgi:hypothetical protein
MKPGTMRSGTRGPSSAPAGHDAASARNASATDATAEGRRRGPAPRERVRRINGGVIYLTREPLARGRSGERIAIPDASLPARIIPRLSTPRSMAGARFATTTT